MHVEYGYDNREGIGAAQLAADEEAADQRKIPLDTILKSKKYILFSLQCVPNRTWWGGARDYTALVVDFDTFFKQRVIVLDKAVFNYSEHFGHYNYFVFSSTNSDNYCESFMRAHMAGNGYKIDPAPSVKQITIRLLGVQSVFGEHFQDGKLVVGEIPWDWAVNYSVQGPEDIPYLTGEFVFRVSKSLVPPEALKSLSVK